MFSPSLLAQITLCCHIPTRALISLRSLAMSWWLQCACVQLTIIIIIIINSCLVAI